MPNGAVWTSGSDVEVAWTQKAWHGRTEAALSLRPSPH
jgi:hypothetical protein